MERAELGVTERIGPIEMTVAVVGADTLSTPSAGVSPESTSHWEQRADALAAWLLAEWQRERKEAA